MTTKHIIKYQGTDVEVEFNDKLTYGVLRKIAKKAFTWNGNRPDVDKDILFIELAMNAFKSTAFKAEQSNTYDNMQPEEVDQLQDIIFDRWPVTYFLAGWMKALSGKEFDRQDLLQMNLSTLQLPEDSVGVLNKQIE